MREQLSNSWPVESGAIRAIRELIGALDHAGVRYCHWKSNAKLDEALRGRSDLDLLVARADAAHFQAVIGSLGYKPCVSEGTPSICHYYGFDEESGRLVHVHAYYRIITGGAVLKNYRLPLEGMLLGETRRIEGVSVPGAVEELISLVVRKTLECASPIEALFFVREGRAIREEVAWLNTGVTEGEISRLLRAHLPNVDVALWERCREAIASGSTVRCFLLGRSLSARLRPYRRHSRARAALARSLRLVAKLSRRVARRPVSHVLLSGGAVVAVVGPDGSGKSTIVGELATWLGTCLRVRRIHAGKPPPSVATVWLRVWLPLLRRLAPRYRKTSVDGESHGVSERGAEALRHRRLFFLYALRAVTSAHERKRLLVRAHADATSGTVIVSDRYPTLQPGVPEGPALSFLLSDRNPFYAWLARLEGNAYRAIPPPDLVLYLEVPVDIACYRNLTRDKAEAPKPTEVIRRRHALTTKLQFPGVTVQRVSTDDDLQMTLRPVKEIVWKAL
jgi:thymidylate kinase